MSHVQGTGKGRRDGEKLQRAFPLHQPSAKGPSLHTLPPHPPCPKEVLERGCPQLAAHCWKQSWWHHGLCGTVGSLAPPPNRHALACHLPTLDSVCQGEAAQVGQPRACVQIPSWELSPGSLLPAWLQLCQPYASECSSQPAVLLGTHGFSPALGPQYAGLLLSQTAPWDPEWAQPQEKHSFTGDRSAGRRNP